MTLLAFVTPLWLAGGMRIAAIGDAHLGRSYYPITTEGGGQPAGVRTSSGPSRPPSRWPWPSARTWWCGWATSSTTPAPATAPTGWPSGPWPGSGTTASTRWSSPATTTPPACRARGSPYSSLADTFEGFHFAHRLAYERFDLRRPGRPRRPPDADRGGGPRRPRRGGPEPQRRQDEPAAHPPPPHPAAAEERRHQRDRGGRQPAAVRPGPPRALPHLRQGHRRPCGTPGRPTRSASPTTPMRAKGIVVLDTDTGTCRHVPVARCPPPGHPGDDLRPGSVARPSWPNGSWPRPSASRRGRWPACTSTGSTPRPTGCSTCRPSTTRPGPACCSSWSRSSRRPTMHAELPTVEGLGGQWEGYLAGQDLTGLDRDRLVKAGHELHHRPPSKPPVDPPSWPAVLLNRIYLRNFRVYEDELDLDLPPGPGRHLRAQRGRQVDPARSDRLRPVGPRPARPRTRSARRGSAATASPRSASSTRATCYVVRRTPVGDQRHDPGRGPGRRPGHGHRGARHRALHALRARHGRRRLPGVGVRRAEAAGRLQQPVPRRAAPPRAPAPRHHPARRAPATRPARTPGRPGSSIAGCGTCSPMWTCSPWRADADARAAAAEAAAETEEAAVEVQRSRVEEAASALAAAETGKAAYDALVADGHAARADLDRAGAAAHPAGRRGRGAGGRRRPPGRCGAAGRGPRRLRGPIQRPLRHARRHPGRRSHGARPRATTAGPGRLRPRRRGSRRGARRPGLGPGPGRRRRRRRRTGPPAGRPFIGPLRRSRLSPLRPGPRRRLRVRAGPPGRRVGRGRQPLGGPGRRTAPQ